MSAQQVGPDVLGLKAPEARRRCEEAGLGVDEAIAAPPRGTAGGCLRVVAQRGTAERAVLMVAAFPQLPAEARQES